MAWCPQLPAADLIGRLAPRNWAALGHHVNESDHLDHGTTGPLSCLSGGRPAGRWDIREAGMGAVYVKVRRTSENGVYTYHLAEADPAGQVDRIMLCRTPQPEYLHRKYTAPRAKLSLASLRHSPMCCQQWEMSRSLLNIEKRSLPRLMLSGVGLASKDAV